MDLEHRTAALLTLVAQYRERRCAEMLEPARAEARQLLRTARADARRRVQTAIREARERLAAEVSAAEAALATERRLAAQRHAAVLLAGAWDTLRSRLAARWQQSDSRARWVERYGERALGVLPRGIDGWRIVHAVDWPAAERERLRANLAARGITSLKFVADGAITAGLRFGGGHNVLDATLDGLLAERAALEGRLLHALQEPA